MTGTDNGPGRADRRRGGPQFRSPLRGPWLTSMFGAMLLVGLPVVIVTGLLSFIAYGPQFVRAFPSEVDLLRLPYFQWPTSPSWLYCLTQGLHVGVGLILVPIVLAKLWSVIPKFFAMPPVRSIAQGLERLSLIALVGGILFEIVTGVLNIQYDYLFGFDFYTAHYWGAWVFTVGFLTHAVLKVPIMVRTLRSRSLMEILHQRVADTEPEPPGDTGLVSPDPRPPTVSRRGALALVGGGAVFVAVLTVGQSTGGFLRNAALLIPRGRSYGDGPNDLQINRTAAAARITSEQTGDGWQLQVLGGTTPLALNRQDLAAAAGAADPDSAVVVSLEQSGAFTEATLAGNQIGHEDSLLALRVNDADLSLDHGFPARIIVPALPGVHNTKWVSSIEFMGEAP